MEEKKVLLEDAKIDHLIIIEFTRQFSNIKACDFINEVLVNKIGTKHLVIGYNHHFGRRGEGDFKTIKKCAESLDIIVEQAQGFQTEEGAISSSIIREALLSGKLDEANKWLGYSYSVTGMIVKGRQLGRTIGFPTANILPNDQYKLIPAAGVYAVEVYLDDIKYPGMLSIGSNPTVNSDNKIRSIEVHILNFDHDVYGRKISVKFRKRLRDEKKFDNTEQLAKQMELDKLNSLQILT
jgi:riboflavin kinase/FMN adenylyltransferase